MNYCEHCMLLTPSDQCPTCGASSLTAPEEGQPCFLIEKESLWSGMLADVLSQKSIPFSPKPLFGAGLSMKAGPAMERYRFYVPFSFYPAAQEIVEELFGESDGQ